jgi:hypothetical protein
MTLVGSALFHGFSRFYAGSAIRAGSMTRSESEKARVRAFLRNQ